MTIAALLLLLLLVARSFGRMDWFVTGWCLTYKLGSWGWWWHRNSSSSKATESAGTHIMSWGLTRRRRLVRGAVLHKRIVKASFSITHHPRTATISIITILSEKRHPWPVLPTHNKLLRGCRCVLPMDGGWLRRRRSFYCTRGGWTKLSSIWLLIFVLRWALQSIVLVEQLISTGSSAAGQKFNAACSIHRVVALSRTDCVGGWMTDCAHTRRNMEHLQKIK